MKNLIIFDCDGTLVDSEMLYNGVTADLLGDIGLPEYTLERCLEEFTGHSWSTIRARLIDKHGSMIPDDIIQQYIERASRAMEHDLQAVPDATSLIRGLRSTHKLCVASNGERGNVLKSLRLTGLMEFFDEDAHIFTKIQVTNPKPAPDLFLFAADRMETHPQHCLVIEDSPTGVRAAKAAGMPVIGFIGTAHTPKQAETALLQAGADHICTRLIHIPELLKTLE